MKKKILGFVLIIASQMVTGAPYPEKINNNKPFTRTEDFADLYQKVYEDTNNYELEEIKNRICAYEGIDCEKTFQLESFEDIINSIRVKTTGEKLSEERFRIFLDNKINFEIELLKREQNIDRKSSMALIYSDGDAWENGGYKEKNSPFDITKTLNDLDELFFGEKKNHFSPLFLKRQEKQNVRELWLNQTEEMLEEQSIYGEADVSFSGILEYIGQIFFQNINSHSLICTKNTKNIFQYPFCTKPTGHPKPGVKSFETPQASTDIPESQKILEEDFGENFNSILLKIMKSSDCESQDIRKERAVNKTKFSGLDAIEVCQRERQRELQSQMVNFQRQAAFDDIYLEYNGIKKSLENYKGALDFFIDYSSKMIKRWNSINAHPKG